MGRAGDAISIGAPGTASGPAPGWTVSPRIDISEAFDTNPDAGGFGGGRGANGGGSDFVTTISPSVAVSGDLPNVSLNAVYAPQLSIYARDSGRTGLGHNLNANAQAVLVQDALYLQASANAAYVPDLGGSRSGGYNGLGGFQGVGANPNGTGLNGPNFNGPAGVGGLGPFGANGTGLSNRSASQYFSFNVGPYYVHRFGDIGTFKAGVTYGYSTNDNSNGNTNAFSPDPAIARLQRATGNSSESSIHEVAQFATGDILGRTRGVTLLSLTQYDGSGVSSGAYENFFTQQVGYAITRQVTVFAEGGYEQIRYKTTPITNIEDAIWSGGVQLTPDPDSVITVGYGHKFGYDSVFANGRYQVTARTSVSGAYTTGLGTALQAVEDLVGASTLDPYGGGDSYNGAPVALTSGVIGTASNNNLYRLRELTLNASTVYDRDTYQLSLVQQQQDLVGTAVPGLGASSQNSLSAILSWTHALNPALSSSLSGSVGTQRQGGQSGHDTTFGADETLSYIINDTTTTYARYTFFRRESGIPGSSYDEHVVLVGISKSF